MENLSKYQDMLPGIRQIIKNSLTPLNGERYNFDENVVENEILLFIFRDSPNIQDHDRYEWLSRLQSKASLIAQGWKINYASGVKYKDETLNSIAGYIKATYGVERERYAA